jgi:putative protein kinase ArgK-like GTPase of G3E family
MSGRDAQVPHVDISKLRAGYRIAVARGISLIENELDESRELVRAMYPLTGKCYRIAITGPLGSQNPGLPRSGTDVIQT